MYFPYDFIIPDQSSYCNNIITFLTESKMLNSFLFGLESLLAYYIYKQYTKRIVNVVEEKAEDNDDQPAEQYECIFLSTNKLVELGDGKTGVTSYMTPIIQFINEAQHTLDICYYIITDPNVVNAIVTAKTVRKVNVRIIVDYTAGFVNNIGVNEFYKADITVYTAKVDFNVSIMHQKFCIKDKESLLMGSINLSLNSTGGSFDNIIITKDLHFLNQYQTHFDALITEEKVILGLTV